MTNQEDPAFPFTWVDGSGENNVEPGLTKREYFIARAMQGIMSNSNAHLTRQSHFEDIAVDAIRIADALIEQLNKNHD